MQPDENKSDVQKSGSTTVPTGLNQTSNLTGKEILISGSPQVPSGLENLVHVNEVPELDGIEAPMVSEPIVVSEKVVSEKPTTLTQHPSVTVKISNTQETTTSAPAVTSFRTMAKGDFRDAKVDEARIKVREQDRKEYMKGKGIVA